MEGLLILERRFIGQFAVLVHAWWIRGSTTLKKRTTYALKPRECGDPSPLPLPSCSRSKKVAGRYHVGRLVLLLSGTEEQDDVGAVNSG